MNRKRLYALFVILWAVAATSAYYHGGPVRAFDSPLRLILELLFFAFLTPAIVPLGILFAIARTAFDLHSDGMQIAVLICSAAFWFFPGARVRRWFGVFDAFRKSGRPRSRVLRGLVFLLDELDRRRFGRQKAADWS